jgi:Cu-processing system ATP-binding protein
LTNNVIELRGVVKHFGETCAVDGVDLAVQEGELFGLIGHNGAGKTTLFKLMLGLLPATAGEIRIGGQPVRGEAFDGYGAASAICRKAPRFTTT